MIKSITAVCLISLGLMAGASPAFADCRDVKVEGTVAGGIIGGIIGNQFGHGSGKTAATIGGVILGGIAGNAIARDSCRDKHYDAYYYGNTYDDAFNSRDERDYGWENPYSHNRGSVRPTDYYEDGYRDHPGPCRRFEQRIWIDGREETGTGIACRNPDGSWQILNES